jgi:hypothetical protein
MWSGGGRGGGRCQPLAVTTSEIEERRLTAWRPSPFSHLDRRRHGNGEWGLSGMLLLVNVCGVASFGASDFWGAKNVSNFGACSVASNLTRQPGQGVSATTFSLSLSFIQISPWPHYLYLSLFLIFHLALSLPLFSLHIVTSTPGQLASFSSVTASPPLHILSWPATCHCSTLHPILIRYRLVSTRDSDLFLASPERFCLSITARYSPQ